MTAMTPKKALPKRTLTVLSIASAAALVTSFTAASAAGPTPQAAITARQAGFKKIGGAMKTINDQIRSGAPGKETVLGAAQTINAAARQQGALFPAGSGASAGVKTDALPAIWNQRAAFDAQMDRLVAESAKLATIAGAGDASALAAQYRATGAVCAACHRQFRADND
jgi:cytochrome c556